MKLLHTTRRSGVTLIECIIVIALIGILSGILMSAVMMAREANARLECQSHLRQIGLGLQLYHQDHHVFPPGVTHPGGPLGAQYGPAVAPYPLLHWHARILPYIEYNNLWKQTVRAYHESGGDPYSPLHPSWVQIPLFLCPTDGPRYRPEPDFPATTSYVGVEGSNQMMHDGILFLDSRIRIADVSDGTSHTLLVGERPASQDALHGA